MTAVKDIEGRPMQIPASARNAIQDLVSDYAHALDDDELERWPEFFTEDGHYKIISRENNEAGMPLGIMSCDGRGMMQDRILALRTANIYEPQTYCHILGPTRIEKHGDIYRARTNFSVIRTMQDGADTRFATGKYVDECVVEGERTVFRSRLVVTESRRVDVLMVIPL
jgi:anthranilate 1,2-dioxygenase small subunit